MNILNKKAHNKKKKTNSQPKQELKLKEIIKLVLITNYIFSEEVANSILEDAKEKLGDQDFQKT